MGNMSIISPARIGVLGCRQLLPMAARLVLLPLALFAGSVVAVGSTFSAEQLDLFLDDAVQAPKIELSMPDGRWMIIFPDADASWDNDRNFGGERMLNLKQGEKKVALVRFGLGAVRAAPRSATLRLTVTRGVPAGQGMKVFAVTRGVEEWDEITVNRGSQPETGELLQEFREVAEGHVCEVDVTAQVLAAFGNGEGVAFKLKTDTRGDNIYVWSREHAYMKFDHSIGQRFTAHDPHNMVNSKTFFLMALACFHDPDAVSIKGIPVRTRLLELLRSILLPGHEPDAGGRLEWSHCPVVLALTLIRHTDAIWKEELTDSERETIAAIMRAMAVAGNYCHEDDNDFTGNVALQGVQKKSWNPNHVEPYVAALIAGSLFFGGEELDRVFATFDYAAAMADLERLGRTNIVTTWRQTTAATMESQGVTKEVPKHGRGLGVNAPCTYSGVPNDQIPHYNLRQAGLGDPFGIYNNLAQKLYAWEATDVVERGGKVIGAVVDADAPPNPVRGKLGMLYEYDAGDANGARSCSAYVFDGWQNNITTAATLMALGRWGEQTDPVHLADLEERMVTGAEDFRHKLKYGWKGRKNGQGSTVRGFSVQQRLMFLLWDDYVRPRLH